MKQLAVSMVGGIAALVVGCGAEGLATEEVTYQDNGTRMQGYLAYDAGVEGKRPGVPVVHEWWGHNEHARNSARRLAELGYTALAVDMYGSGKQADHPKEAGQFAGEVRKNLDLAKTRFQAAMETLKQHATTDPGEIAAIGYCFGGGVVLTMAREGMDLDAVVSVHGSLPTDRPPSQGQVKARVLVLHGAEDKVVKPEQVAAFKAQMEAAGADYRVAEYAGAAHGFTNPKSDELAKKFELPIGYDAEADRESWAEMKRFLAQVFGQ